MTGTELTSAQLTDVFLKLEDLGAHNINLVTPTHFVPAIVPALERAKELGLRLPVVYNTGTYETVDTLHMLDGLVDIWLPDFKYADPDLAARYSFAPDYFDVASAALEEMVRQTRAAQRHDTWVPDLCAFDLQGMMTRGVIVRHLILPGCTEDSKSVLRYLYETYGDDIYLSPAGSIKNWTGASPTPSTTRSSTTRWTSASPMHSCRRGKRHRKASSLTLNTLT